MKIKLNRLNRIAALGSQKDVELANGNWITQFVLEFKFKYALYKPTMSETISSSTDSNVYKNSFSLIVRHSPKFDPKKYSYGYMIQIDNVNYDFVSLQQDFDVNGFDLITVKKAVN